MAVKVDIEQAVMSILADYVGAEQEVVDKAVADTTKEAAKSLRQKSPKRTGEYAKAWTSKIERSRTNVTGTVYNKEKAWLAHLLENGHAKRNGGRTAPIVHIKPVEQEAAKELERRLTQEL